MITNKEIIENSKLSYFNIKPQGTVVDTITKNAHELQKLGEQYKNIQIMAILYNKANEIVKYRVKNIGTTNIKYYDNGIKSIKSGETKEIANDKLILLLSRPEYNFMVSNGYFKHNGTLDSISINDYIQNYTFVQDDTDEKMVTKELYQNKEPKENLKAKFLASIT